MKFLSSEIAKYYFGVVYYILLYFIHKLKVIRQDIQQARYTTSGVINLNEQG